MASPGGVYPSSKQDISTCSCDISNQTELIPYMDPIMYKAAAKGEFEIFLENSQQLDLLLTPNKNTVLHINIAVQTGGMEYSTHFLEQVLHKCPSLLLQVNTKGETALHIAARQGNAGAVKFLFQFAKSLPTKNDIVKSHHDNEIQSGVKLAAQMLRMQNNEKDTPLHEAARYNHIDVVKTLTQEDRDLPYSVNEAGETPLYLAAERGYLEVVSEILQTCTSPLHRGPNGRTTLHAAVICQNEEMTRKILDVKRTMTKETDQQGWTPLHYAADMGNAVAVNQLLEFGKSAAYMADNDGKKTALHIAAGRGHIDVMKEFLSSCPDCYELVDSRGCNVLHFAVESNSHDGVQLVLENSFLSNLINEKDMEGNTPLHYVAASLTFLPCLISHPKVDAMACNKRNLSALDVVLSHDNSSEIKETIVENLKGAGSRSSRRVIVPKDNNSFVGKEKGDCSTNSDSDGDSIKESRAKNAEGHLIVATLVATVTFAAAFTMPGGYRSNKGRDQGAAVLTGQAAFTVFVIADSIAMMLSSLAVSIHILISVSENFSGLLFTTESKCLTIAELLFTTESYCLTTAELLFTTESYCLTIAIVAMMVAYITGTYAVLSHSHPLAIATCVVGSSVCSFLLTVYGLAKQGGSGPLTLMTGSKSIAAHWRRWITACFK